MPLNNLGLLAMREGRYEEAIARYNESMRLTKKLGPGRPEMSDQWIGLGMIEMCRGRCADARSHFERVRELRTGGLGPTHPETATALTFVDLAEMRLGNHARARSVLEQSLSVRSKALDAEHPDVSDSLVALALVDLEEQAPQAALPRLERAAVIQRMRGADRTVRADRLFAHARALWRLAGDRARARTRRTRGEGIRAGAV
jgi:serine/threonine-protein kinase